MLPGHSTPNVSKSSPIINHMAMEDHPSIEEPCRIREASSDRITNVSPLITRCTWNSLALSFIFLGFFETVCIKTPTNSPSFKTGIFRSTSWNPSGAPDPGSPADSPAADWDPAANDQRRRWRNCPRCHSLPVAPAAPHASGVWSKDCKGITYKAIVGV